MRHRQSRHVHSEVQLLSAPVLRPYGVGIPVRLPRVPQEQSHAVAAWRNSQTILCRLILLAVEKSSDLASTRLQ